ncbi:MAG: hypothetical protein K6E29_04900 [Cyanobacteria bacterium RUI128]|nr:hypothetical protein [Cyanobacteria bacterium RUI128]
MPKYKNYKNKHTNNSVIHTVEDLVKMSFGDVVKREKELASQYKQIGFPTNSDMQNSSNVVYVHEYTREDGTVVRAHWRSKGERTVVNNETSNNNISEQVKDFETYGDYIGNEASVPNTQKAPIYPENGVVKGGISNDYMENKKMIYYPLQVDI